MDSRVIVEAGWTNGADQAKPRRRRIGASADALSLETEGKPMSLDDEMIDTPDGPMTWAQWKKKHPVQIPSRRTKGKKLPVKVKRFTEK